MNSFTLFKLPCEAPSTILWRNSNQNEKKISGTNLTLEIPYGSAFLYVLRLHLRNFNQILLYDY